MKHTTTYTKIYKAPKSPGVYLIALENQDLNAF